MLYRVPRRPEPDWFLLVDHPEAAQRLIAYDGHRIDGPGFNSREEVESFVRALRKAAREAWPESVVAA